MIISGRAKVLGVIGHPVGHSLSPAMHNSAIEALGLDYVYVPFDVTPDSLRHAISGIRALGIAGVNITVPHKETVIPFLDEVDEDAWQFGSVNTIVNDNGKLTGYSTDGPGFMRSLAEAGFSPAGCKAVVIGAGGAGRAVTFALAKAGAEVFVLDELAEKSEKLARDVRKATDTDMVHGEPGLTTLANRLREADLLVNCTPVGMHPNENCTPVQPELLRSELFVYDLVYNPLNTKLLMAAEAAGARTASGIKMLIYQGAISFEKWTGIEPPTEVMEKAIMSHK
jgi:shikimate dehydrogenase